VEVGVAEVVRERCDAWSALAEESGVDLSAVVEVSGPGRAALVGGDLEQVLDNLIANAIDAMPDGGALTVSLSGAESGPWELHVTDQGPGMSEEDRSRAFDRFWQGAGPKASGRSGLGLAIVRQLVVRNGASVRLFAAEPHGIDAVVVFPADLVVRLGGRVARERDGKEITKVG
jgi:signal transduction histidine kinase